MIISGLILVTLALAAVEVFVRAKQARWMGPLAGGLIGIALGAWAGTNDHFIATRVLPIWAFLIYFVYALKVLIRSRDGLGCLEWNPWVPPRRVERTPACSLNRVRWYAGCGAGTRGRRPVRWMAPRRSRWSGAGGA